MPELEGDHRREIKEMLAREEREMYERKEEDEMDSIEPVGIL